MSNCFVLFMQMIPWPLALALASAGMSIPAKIAMIAMTTSNSIKVNPLGPGIEFRIAFSLVYISLSNSDFHRHGSSSSLGQAWRVEQDECQQRRQPGTLRQTARSPRSQVSWLDLRPAPGRIIVPTRDNCLLPRAWWRVNLPAKKILNFVGG